MKPSNVCQHLRTKQLYIPEQAEAVFARQDDSFTHSGHCWCNRTLTETGPDDRQVSLPLCSPQRECFEE
jgi:hypothetical protein